MIDGEGLDAVDGFDHVAGVDVEIGIGEGRHLLGVIGVRLVDIVDAIPPCIRIAQQPRYWYQKNPQPLIVKEEFVEKMCPNIFFTAIERKMGTAIAKEGDLESVVSIAESPRTLSFVEISYGGAMVVTTIYRQEALEKNMLLSVRSDHTFALKFPVPTQFFGACEIIE